MTKKPTKKEQLEKVFKHTGIRVMTEKDGDILFCGSVIKDCFYVSRDAMQHMDVYGKAIMWDKLMHYIKNHKKQPCNTSFDFPTND